MMMRLLILILLSAIQAAQAGECNYPKKSINWILRYCAMVSETDDEMVIQNSACFKAAIKDVGSSDQCKTKEKYKRKICEEFLMETKRYRSVNDCLANDETEPYVSG